MIRFLTATFLFSVVLCENAKIGVLETAIKTLDGKLESETIAVELKKPNEDIRFVAHIRIHLVEGNIHINGHRLEHNTVHYIRMMVQVSDIVNGVKKIPTSKAVNLRVMIEETNVGGVRHLLVEEEFISIGDTTVEQINVHQIFYESEMRRPTLIVKLSESKIHSKPREKDHRMFFHDEKSIPHLPKHGLNYDGPETADKHHHHKHHCHHHRHHHHNCTFFRRHAHSAKCWYQSLSWKSKVMLFSLGFFGLLTVVMGCVLCAKRRQAKQRLLVNAPMDDDVSVNNDDGLATKDGAKKLDDNKYDFHFEFDNEVVVNDRKPLVDMA